MADFITTAITAIEATLLQLYAKKERSLSQKDRAIVFAQIKDLESSRKSYLAEQARTTGARPLCATVDLQSCASADEGE